MFTPAKYIVYTERLDDDQSKINPESMNFMNLSNLASSRDFQGRES